MSDTNLCPPKKIEECKSKNKACNPKTGRCNKIKEKSIRPRGRPRGRPIKNPDAKSQIKNIKKSKINNSLVKKNKIINTIYFKNDYNKQLPIIKINLTQKKTIELLLGNPYIENKETYRNLYNKNKGKIELYGKTHGILDDKQGTIGEMTLFS